MGTNKKPRKPHRPFIPIIPMMREARDAMAMSLHAAIETLICAPDIEAYNNFSTKLITFGYAVGRQDCLEDAKRAMTSIAERHDRVGRIGVDAKEAAALRQASGAMDRMLARIPVNKLLAAELKTQIFVERII